MCLRVPPRDFFPSILVMSAVYLPTPTEGHEGPRLQLEPLLTCSAGAAVLSRVVLEFRVKLHEMNRVAEF